MFPRFPVPSFPPLRFGLTFSSPDFYSPAFSVPHADDCARVVAHTLHEVQELFDRFFHTAIQINSQFKED